MLGVAKKGLFTPLWSDRILEEWARATVKLGPGAQVIARGEIALMRAEFPNACLPKAGGIEARLMLPDANDTHVLAVAISGGADAIITSQEIETLRLIEKLGYETSVCEEAFNIGQVVNIKQGAFKGHQARVVDIGKDGTLYAFLLEGINQCVRVKVPKEIVQTVNN